MAQLISKFSSLIAAIAFAGILSMGSASAAMYTQTGTCELDDISAEARQCYGSVLPVPVNDSEDLLNNNTFSGFTGLFGHTDWDLLAKQNMADPDKGTLDILSGTDIGLSVVETSKGVGTWSVTTGELSTFDRVVLILTAGNTFSSYLYEPGSKVGDSGTWKTVALDNKNLSHFSVYTNGISPVPVPAAVWLFGTALIGFIGFSRRTKV
jgi:hypothetical protein